MSEMDFMDESSEEGYLTGQLLLAMPTMSDPRFERSVIYMCAHTDKGAMGIVVNRLAESISFPDLLEQLEIETPAPPNDIRVHFGGPVETGRGFVLHSADYLQASSLQVDDSVALTATIDILKDMAAGGGPKQCLLALGYAGWSPGQLDAEIQNNGWLSVEADPKLLFDIDLDAKWDRAMQKIGLDVSKLSGSAGHA